MVSRTIRFLVELVASVTLIDLMGRLVDMLCSILVEVGCCREGRIEKRDVGKEGKRWEVAEQAQELQAAVVVLMT